MEFVFLSSVFVVVWICKDDEREDDEEELFLDRDVFDSKSLSDEVSIVGFFLFDDDSDDVSSDETSNGSNVSEPKVAWTCDDSTKIRKFLIEDFHLFFL